MAHNRKRQWLGRGDSGALRCGRSVAAGLLLSSSLLLGCGSEGDLAAVKRRSGAVVIEACSLDAGQQQALQSDALRSVVGTAILLCPAIHEGGALPKEADGLQVLNNTISTLRGAGLRVELGITARDDAGQPLSATRLAALLHDPVQRDVTATAAAQFDARADGLVIALPALPDTATADVTAWVQALAAWTPGRKPSIFAPPSSTEPSDLPEGSAVNLKALSGSLRTVYAMTVDYSCCEGTPGPTTEADWTAQVVSLAGKQAGQKPLFMAQPLYGYRFVAGTAQPVSYLAAAGLASAQHIQVLRTQDGSLQYSFVDANNRRNEVWFDDARSLARRLAYLDSRVAGDVGVLYYSLGGEDPKLWSTLQGLMR